MATIDEIAAKYGHEMQNDAVKGEKLNEAFLHRLLTTAGIAKKKIDDAASAQREYDSVINTLNQMARNLSFNEKQKAKEIFKQYKNAPKILGLY